MLEELKRKRKLKKYVTELKNKKIVLSKNNHLIITSHLENKKSILKLDKIDMLSDSELVNIINYYDQIYLKLNEKNKKIIIENINEIRYILKNRLIKLIKTAIKIINKEESNYDVIVKTKENLEYYTSILNNKNLSELAIKLDSITMKKGLKQYEKVHLPVKQIY